jgi:hypothetical protein
LIADPREAIRELDELVALVDAGDAKDIMDALSSHEAEGRVGTLILGRWLSLDPSAAIAWLMNREVIPGGQATLVAKTLLEVPGRLQGYLEGVKDEGRRQQLLSSAGFEIVATDPRQALVLAEGMKPGELRSALVQNSVFEWGRRNPEEAKRWVEAVDDPALRERLAAWGAKGCARGGGVVGFLGEVAGVARGDRARGRAMLGGARSCGRGGMGGSLSRRAGARAGAGKSDGLGDAGRRRGSARGRRVVAAVTASTGRGDSRGDGEENAV